MDKIITVLLLFLAKETMVLIPLYINLGIY